MHFLSFFYQSNPVSLFEQHKNKYLNQSIFIILVEQFYFVSFFASWLRKYFVNLLDLIYFNNSDFIR